MMTSMRRCLLIAGTFLFFVGCAAAPRQSVAPEPSPQRSSSPPPKLTLEQARENLHATRYEKAEAQLRQLEETGKKEARLLLASLLIETGRLDEALALELPHRSSARAARLVATAHRNRGELERALEVLSAADSKNATTPEDLELRLLRGEIFIEQGKRARAERELMHLIEAYGNGFLEDLSSSQRGQALTSMGRAAHLLRAPRDANEAFNEAEELGHHTTRLLLYRGELFLEKYDTAHASEVAGEAREQAPRHPDVLVLEANIRLAERLAFEEAEELARQALKVDPFHPRAHYVLGSVALRDLDFEEVAEHIDAGLSRNPRHLELLSLRAAARFLAEDEPGFQQALDHVLELSPGYSRALYIVAEHAEWEHRYEDMERLLRRAVRLDPKDGRSRGRLGLTLVRAGSDSAGVVELRAAFARDPFNVRVKNTLELYETIIPENYVEHRRGPFRLRVPKEEEELLMRYVPELLSEAYAVMKERYGYEPRAPLSIELYGTRDQFAVRTSGLPRTPIHGVCFGRKLATMSPQASPGNLGMTLWHELGHVFHIGLSKSRVPRWLTEGLAEWETEHLERGWSRELDRELYRAYRARRLPHLGSMSRAFTHAKRMQDVATAYYASGRIAQWLVESRGEETVAELLAAFGEKRLPSDVLPAVLGASLEKLDESFRSWLEEELSRYRGQFVSRETRLSVREARARWQKKQSPPKRKTQLAQALLKSGEKNQAVELLMEAKDADPQAAYTLAELRLSEEKFGRARALLEEMVKEGHDGYEPRLLLGKALVKEKEFESALEHLEKATEFDPSSEEPWALLAAVQHVLERPEPELRAVRQWAARAEHDGPVHRRLLELLLSQNALEEARAVVERAIWSDLGNPETHRLAARVFNQNNDLKQAEFEWESALLCQPRPKTKRQVVEEWTAALERRGLFGRAEAVRKQWGDDRTHAP